MFYTNTLYSLEEIDYINYNPNTANDTLAIRYHRVQIKNACSSCLQFAFLHVIAQITLHNFVSNIFFLYHEKYTTSC